jgi:hypothetical protein
MLNAHAYDAMSVWLALPMNSVSDMEDNWRFENKICDELPSHNQDT